MKYYSAIKKNIYLDVFIWENDRDLLGEKSKLQKNKYYSLVLKKVFVIQFFLLQVKFIF